MRPNPACVPVCLVVCLLGAMAVSSPAQTTPQNRIMQAIDGREMVSLPGNVHPMARPEFDQGRLNALTPLQAVTLNFKLSASQQADLEQLMAEQQDPASPNYHKWLAPEQYAARFGMSQSDLDQVTTWVQAQGFTNIQTSRGHNRVSFDGTVARVEAAFHTEMHNYAVNGETHFANANEPSLPSAFADSVLGFRHLDNFSPRSRARRIPAPHFTSSQSGNHFLTPGDVVTIYDIGPLYTAGIDGTGITIAVLGQTVINVSDINTFRTLSGLPANPPVIRQAPLTTNPTTCTSDLDEASLDVEWSGGVAKGATILYDFAGVGDGKTCAPSSRIFNVFDALFDVIDNNLAAVISISYGDCEVNIGPSSASMLRAEIQRGISQGQTLTASSGDSGAADCESATATTATHGLAVDLPGAIPEVTSVGGTEFTGDNTTGADPPYWAAASGTDNISSALAYIPEMAWNDSPVTGTGVTLSTTLSATGGGASTFYAKTDAPWQTTLTPADGHRDVPDVSLPASPNHDGFLVCSQGSCVNGFRLANGNLNVFGGTSVSSQAFGGVLALINQATKSTKGLGNANQELYALGGTAAFHDITTGNNKVPCTSGSPNCPTSGALQIGFSAGTGYDLVTGLGSVDVNALTRAWPGFNLTPTATTTTVTSSSLSAAAGANVTFTATVTSAASGGPNITGTVQFSIDGSNAGSPVPVAFSSGQGFVATFSTSTLATGTHTVAAVYAGASPNYAGSTSASITETIAGFTVAGSNITIATPGISGTSTVTVTPGGGFTGMVNLTCTPPAASSEITCSFGSATSVNITSSASASATLTISTTAAHAKSTTSADARPGSHGRLGWFTASAGAFFAGIFAIGVPSCRRRWIALFGLMLCVFLAVGVGCGGGSTSTITDPGTAAGSYTVVVTATSGGISQTANVMVTVQ
jgi:subtilase family serine protease